MRVTYLIVGPERHGVVQCATRVAGALTGVEVRAASAVDEIVVGSADVVHLHVTDRLFGSPASVAASAVESIAAGVRRARARFVVTLHDLPQPSDGRSAAARVECYRRVVAAADLVIVSSDHERTLLHDAGIEPGAIETIPLPVDARPSTPRPAEVGTVGVLGFLYPGKGHLEVLRALPVGAELVALGTPSPGHDDLVDELARTAHHAGTSFRITGYLDDADLPTRLGDIAVPVAHHRHMSASGSINTWIEHGRRPLVVAGSYTREFDRRSPGTVTLYDEGDLPTALARALADPASTWLSPGATAHPTLAEVARLHTVAYERLVT